MWLILATTEVQFITSGIGLMIYGPKAFQKRCQKHCQILAFSEPKAFSDACIFRAKSFPNMQSLG